MKTWIVIIFLVFSYSCSSLSSNIENLNSSGVTGKWRIDEYEDDRRISSFFYENGVLMQRIVYELPDDQTISVTNYHYSANNKFDRIESSEDDSYGDSLQSKMEREFYLQSEYLELRKQLKLPVSKSLLFSEVGDLDTMLSVADNDSSFKKEIKEDGDRKIIKFPEIDKRFRFYQSSYIGLFINVPDRDVIYNYELTLNNNYPTKEIYVTNVGKLVREYTYENNRVVRVLNKFTTESNELRLERRFAYYRL